MNYDQKEIAERLQVLLEKLKKSYNDDINKKLAEKSRLDIYKMEKIIFTYDARDEFTKHNGEAKDRLVQDLKEIGYTLIYSPTKSTLILGIDKGTFVFHRDTLLKYINSLPKKDFFFFSLALIQEVENYFDSPDLSLNYSLI